VDHTYCPDPPTALSCHISPGIVPSLTLTNGRRIDGVGWTILTGPVMVISFSSLSLLVSTLYLSF